MRAPEDPRISALQGGEYVNDYKQLCAELLDFVERLTKHYYEPAELTIRARAALAQPEPEGPNNEPKIGDYVLATKWSDGDPCDHFRVGFFAGKDRDRYKVVDSDGNLFRANGFRRCETITQAEGESILSLKIGDKPGPSVWGHLERIRGIEAQPEPEGPTLAEIDDLCAEHTFYYEDDESLECLLLIITDALARWGRPAPQPVPVSERLPGPGDWVWHCYAGVRFWQHGIYNGCQFFVGDGPESQPATHWLPADALPLPQPH